MMQLNFLAEVKPKNGTHYRSYKTKVKANIIRQGYKADDCIDLRDDSVI